jgi:hypothetical protein
VLPTALVFLRLKDGQQSNVSDVASHDCQRIYEEPSFLGYMRRRHCCRITVKGFASRGNPIGCFGIHLHFCLRNSFWLLPVLVYSHIGDSIRVASIFGHANLGCRSSEDRSIGCRNRSYWPRHLFWSAN